MCAFKIWKCLRQATLILPILITNAVAVELAPDDASVAGDLGLWLRDAANTFDEETGIWADSSGNDRHAIPVGEVTVASPVTYLAPMLATVTGSDLSAEDVPSVRFDGPTDDLLVSTDLNGDAGLTDLTVFLVMNVDLGVANAGLTRPAGFGSLAATQANAGDHFNIASDPSIRKDNGQIGAGTYSVVFPTATTFIRTTRMSATAIDDWFNTDGTLMNGLSVTGASYTTSSDEFYLGDVRAGITAVPGFGGAATANFDIVQSIVYTTALTDQQVADINEWLVSNITGGSGGPGDLAFTDIDLAADQFSAELTFRSKPNKTYALDLSADLEVWEELFDDVESEGASTSVSAPTFSEFVQPATPPGKVYFRVREQ